MKKELHQCKNCGKDTIHKLYCSNNCRYEFQKKERLSKIEKDGVPDSANGRRSAREYLIKRDGHKCSICGTTEWLGKPILLIVDHIDGNTDHNTVENFRLVCSNCDATLPTYKGRNKSCKRKARN
jgi:hypothetical protein